MLRQRDQRAAAAQNSGLFARDRRDGRAEPLHVVERDVGHRSRAADPRCWSRPAARPCPLRARQRRCPRRRNKRNASAVRYLENTGQLRQSLLVDQLPRQVVYAKEIAGEVFVRDQAATDTDAFVDPFEMRRGVEAGFQPGFDQDRSQCRGCRALAIRSGDQNRTKTGLRIAHGFEQNPNLVEREFSSRLTGPVKSSGAMAFSCSMAAA